MYRSARHDYVSLCDELETGYLTLSNGDVGKPDDFDQTNPAHLNAFEYGRLWQARETLYAFAAQLGIEGYEDHEVVAYVPPIPDDISSLYEQDNTDD